MQRKQIVPRLTRLREARGLTGAELARRAELDVGYVWRIETG